MLRHAVRLNSLTELAADQARRARRLRDGQGVHRLPPRRSPADALPGPLRRARPRRAGLRDAAGVGHRARRTCARPGELPAAARALIELVEREVGIPVRVVGVGAERDDYVLWTREPFIAFPGHAGRRWPLPRWRSVARTTDAARMIERYSTPRWRRCGPTRPASGAGWRSSCWPPRPTPSSASCPPRTPQPAGSGRRSSTTRSSPPSSSASAPPTTTWPPSSTSCSRRIGAPAGSWIHYGLTSSDVVDTALCWAMRDAADLVLGVDGRAADDDGRAGPDPPATR